MVADSRSFTKKNYKCVKATINSIKKLQQKTEDSYKNISLFSNLADLKYIQQSTIFDKLTNLVGERIIDAVMYFPVNYELWQHVKNFSQIENGKFCCIETTIQEVKTPSVPFYIAKQKHIPTVVHTITFDGYKLDLVFFHIYPNIIESLKPGRKIVCQGRLTIDKKGKFTMAHPHFSSKIQNETGCSAIFKLKQLEDDGIDIKDLNIYKITPIYSLTEGIKQAQLTTLIEKILKNNNNAFDFSVFDRCDDVCNNIYKNLPTFFETVNRLHFPSSIDDICKTSKYIKKMAFLELLGFQYVISKARQNRELKNGVSIKGTGNIVNKVIQNLPFKLTQDQIECIEEIKTDQASNKKMLRLLQGDVGSGKTIVALLSALNTIESGYKVIIMAPTAILAKQHFMTIQKFCFGIGISSELLIGETKQKARKDIMLRMSLGQIDILVGTHTLFQKSLDLPKNVGLFIIDEQHNFGVEQRVNLINKCDCADILMMSATPIPRTMIMGLYGDIGVSCIEHKPADRLPIETKILSIDEKYNALVEGLKRKIELGEQIYWICPLVEESEKLDYIDVNSRGKALADEIGKEKIGILHGKMSQEKKDQMMLDFKNKKISLLIATTVIEVGIDVPNATIIVIENAEKFGLAQLHQLRGRVGRGSKQSYCFLLYSNKISETGRKRLEILKDSDNGFQIAEFDLKLRGGGTLLNNKQSGFKSMNFVDFTRDKTLISYLNSKQIINIDFNNIKPILDIFSITAEVEANGMFSC